jgi:hypothetical protein
MPKISISNKLVSANSSVNTQTSTATGVTRLSNLPTNIIADPTVPTTVTTNIKQESVSDATLARLAKVASSALAPANQLGTALPLGYKFNLPPHDWSLPLRPATVDPDLVGTTNDSSFHGLRRGRIWYWAGANNLTTNTSTTTTNSGYETPSSSSAPLNLIDTTWGFQFLWNPTTISTSVSRNMDITPSSADTLRVVAGVFPGQETVNL